MRRRELVVLLLVVTGILRARVCVCVCVLLLYLFYSRCHWLFFDIPNHTHLLLESNGFNVDTCRWENRETHIFSLYYVNCIIMHT